MGCGRGAGDRCPTYPFQCPRELGNEEDRITVRELNHIVIPNNIRSANCKVFLKDTITSKSVGMKVFAYFKKNLKKRKLCLFEGSLAATSGSLQKEDLKKKRI